MFLCFLPGICCMLGTFRGDCHFLFEGPHLRKVVPSLENYPLQACHSMAGVAFTPLRVSTSVVFGDHRIPGRTADLQPFFGNPCAHGQTWRPPHQHLEVEFLEIFTWRFALSWEVGWPPRKRHPTRRTADSWEVRWPPTYVLPSGPIKTQEGIEKIGGIINSHYSI